LLGPSYSSMLWEVPGILRGVPNERGNDG